MIYSYSVSYCMTCVSVREDNQGTLASGLSPIQTQNHIITCLLHKQAFARCAVRDTYVKHWNTNKKVSEYDQEIPQKHTTDKPMTP